MKNILFLLVIATFYACDNGSKSQKVKDTTLEIKKDTLKSVTPIDSVEIKGSTDTVLTDLNKLNLFGTVKSISTSSQEIDENGEEFGMGGFYKYFEFNQDGFQTLEETDGCCGYSSAEITYKRSESNQLTHRIFKVGELGEPIPKDTPYEKKEKYFYNDKGVLVKIKIAGFDQVLTEEITFKFDDNNRIIKREIHNISKDEYTTVKYKYSENKITETYTNKAGEFDYKEVLFYNDEQQLIKIEMYLSSGSIQQLKFKYEFDEHDNWILEEVKYRYILADGTKGKWKNSTRSKRTIKYY